MQALIKRDMLLAVSCELLNTNFCERNQFLVCIKRLSKFSVQMLRDMYLIFVKTVVVIIKSTTEVPLNTLHKCKLIASREGRGVLPYIGYIGVFGAKEDGLFSRFGLKKGYQFRPVWSGYVFFRKSYFFITRRLDHFPLGFTPTEYVPQQYSFVSYLIKAYKHCL